MATVARAKIRAFLGICMLWILNGHPLYCDLWRPNNPYRSVFGAQVYCH